MSALLDLPDQIIFPGSASVNVPNLPASREGVERLNAANIWRAKYYEWLIEYQMVTVQMSFQVKPHRDVSGFSLNLSEGSSPSEVESRNMDKARALVISWKEEE